MDINIEVRKLAMLENVTLTELAKYIENKKQKPYSIQNLSTKLKKGTLNITELEIILKRLGYDINFSKSLE